MRVEGKQSPGHISEAAATTQRRHSHSRPVTKAGRTLGLSAAHAGLIFSPPPTCAASAKRQHTMHLRGAHGEAAQSRLESAYELCSLASSAGDAGLALSHPIPPNPSPGVLEARRWQAYKSGGRARGRAGLWRNSRFTCSNSRARATRRRESKSCPCPWP